MATMAECGLILYFMRAEVDRDQKFMIQCSMSTHWLRRPAALNPLPLKRMNGPKFHRTRKTCTSRRRHFDTPTHAYLTFPSSLYDHRRIGIFNFVSQQSTCRRYRTNVISALIIWHFEADYSVAKIE